MLQQDKLHLKLIPKTFGEICLLPVDYKRDSIAHLEPAVINSYHP